MDSDKLKNSTNLIYKSRSSYWISQITIKKNNKNVVCASTNI